MPKKKTHSVGLEASFFPFHSSDVEARGWFDDKELFYVKRCTGYDETI